MSDGQYRISDKSFFAGKNVLVMGLGLFGGGVDVARFAHLAGADVTVTDMASQEQLNNSVEQLNDCPDICFHLGEHRPADFQKADILIVNPAVAEDNEFVKIAHQNAAIVTSQINIFFQLCKARIIAITGANGKSTTAALTAHLLRTQPQRVWLSGNIGNEPLLGSIDQIGTDDLIVLELSSFQTASLGEIQKAPHVSLLTNLTPNHLDRHGTFTAYCCAKENMFKFQKPDAESPAISIFCAEDEVGCRWFDKYNGRPGRLCIKFSAKDVSAEIRRHFTLPGEANLLNLAAAVTIARLFDISDERISSSLSAFKPLPHRLEFAAEKNGVRWYNDSIATTPISAVAALNSFACPKIIIAGGYDKNLDFAELGKTIAQKAKAAVLMGQTAKKISGAIENHNNRKIKVLFADSLENAVDLADNLAEPGDVVLLSPASASYDMFKNFQQRGQQFTAIVQKLTHQ